MNNKTALFIWRFQTPHLGHLDAKKQATAKWITEVIIWVGSANKEYTTDNPFTFEETKTMIHSTFGKDTSVHPIPDFWDDNQWANYVIENMPPFDCVITGNPWVKKIFEARGIPTINLEIKTPIKASHIRKYLSVANKKEIMKVVTPKVVAYLDKIKAYERLKKIYKVEFIKPSISVDGIIIKAGKIVIIERKNPPFGFALPWWFVDNGEDPMDALVREMKEELSVDVRIKKIFNVYGKPDRDPRQHVISIVYESEIIWGELKAWDDAKNLQLLDPSYVEQTLFAFDHKKILLDYLKN